MVTLVHIMKNEKMFYVCHLPTLFQKYARAWLIFAHVSLDCSLENI